jgi:hypothetical protein
MSITFEQAIASSRFHIGECSVSYGVTGKARPKVTMSEWRRNGATKTWKTRPGAFRIPVKHGMYQYGYIEEVDGSVVHTAEDCTALAEAEAWWDTHTEDK